VRISFTAFNATDAGFCLIGSLRGRELVLLAISFSLPRRARREPWYSYSTLCRALCGGAYLIRGGSISAARRRWGVVQLVGHLTVNEDGEGSNPSAPANFPSLEQRTLRRLSFDTNRVSSAFRKFFSGYSPKGVIVPALLVATIRI
jgi:hypothetical protein